MSDTIIAYLLTFGLLGGMFLWVPLLEAICPPCGRFVRARLRRRPVAQATEGGPEPVADLA